MEVSNFRLVNMYFGSGGATSIKPPLEGTVFVLCTFHPRYNKSMFTNCEFIDCEISE